MSEPVQGDGAQALQGLLDAGRRAFRGMAAGSDAGPLKADDLRCRADLPRLDERERLVLAASPASSLQLLALQLAFNEMAAHLLRDTPREVIEASEALDEAGIEEFSGSGVIKTLPERIRELAAASST